MKQKIPPKTKEAIRERLFGDRFSVGATTLLRADTPATLSLRGSSGQASIDEEVRDTATLMRKLKAAAIDREKIAIINRFIADGGEELHYLAEQVRTAIAYDGYSQANICRYPPSCPCSYFRTRVANS